MDFDDVLSVVGEIIAITARFAIVAAACTAVGAAVTLGLFGTIVLKTAFGQSVNLISASRDTIRYLPR